MTEDQLPHDKRAEIEGRLDAIARALADTSGSALAQILEYSQDPDPLVRAEAMTAAGMFDDTTAIRAIVDALSDDDRRVRSGATRALAEILLRSFTEKLADVRPAAVSTAEPSSPCTQCDRPCDPSWRYCPFCGSELAVAAAAGPTVPEEPTEAVPDLSTLIGPCTIVRKPGPSIDVPTVGRIVAKELQLPLYDVTRQMNVSRGFLARGIDAAVARGLVARLTDLELPLFVIEDRNLFVPPEAERARSFVFDAEGFECEVFSPSHAEQCRKAWAEVSLVVAGRLRVETRKTTPVSGEQRAARRKPSPLEAVSSEVVHQLIIDVHLTHPVRHLRIEEGSLDFSLMQRTPAQEEKLVQAAKSLLQYAPEGGVDRGLRMAACGGSDVEWEELTFLSRVGFEEYNLWLLQLLKQGVPLP